ncbi:uncharacterized protein FFFS_13897 [Fusarium fujikuroi]|nr:uncharacterized protein FFFS_13897 [Fusarium fujikuroi]
MSFEDKADRPPFKLSIQQQKAYDATIEHADDLTDAWKENGGNLEAPEIVRLLDLRETAVLELYISVLDHFTKDTEYDSVLVSFLTVLSVRADDNAANETIGHSFIDTLFQRDGGASKGWVIKKVLQDSGLRSKWIKSISDNGIEMNLRMAYRYGLKIEKALELLAVLTHISGGFPLRAWELLVVRHRNTSNGGIRNILCDQGLIMIVTGAYKGFTTTGRLKIIYRFLPREVGTLLAYYLWLVLPFWEDIQANVWDKSIFNAGL